MAVVNTKREPLAATATAVALAGALLTLAVAFGVDLTPDQQAAVLGVVAVIAPIMVAVIVRAKVTPVAAPRLNGILEPGTEDGCPDETAVFPKEQ